MLVLGAALQLALPSSTKLPPDTELAPRRVHDTAGLVAQEYPAVLDRPIFAPDRKPDATAVPVAGGMNGFVALGIAIAGDAVTALVRGPGGTIQRLRPGEDIGGWKLVAADLDQLTFERDKERRVLMISKMAPPVVGAGRVASHPGQSAQVGQMGQSDQSDKSDDSDDSDNSDNDDN